jgi:coenzyme F420 hydrogenase subunit beta
MKSEHPIQNVVESGLCTGCGLCAAICAPDKVSMQMSAAGYLRPHVTIPISVAERQLFDAVCPGVAVRHEARDAAAPSHPIWGPMTTCQTGYSTDAELRRYGSSGGVISALAVYLIESGQVDFVVQNSAPAADPLGNQVQVSTGKDDVLKSAGSRYAPSAPLVDLARLLESGKRFAFIGKPCDVAALRALARHDPRVDQQIPYFLSFMCAGVPSRRGTEAVVRRLGMDGEQLLSFRYRGDGWPGKARAVTTDGRSAEMDYATSWGEILNRHLQFRCKICPDGTGEFADIVCADAWYGEDGYPSFEERDGRSLVLGRSSKGAALIEQARQAGALHLDPLDVAEIAKMQPYQVMRKKVVLGRVLAARLALGRAPVYRNMGLLRASLTARPTMWLRNAVGTFKRAKGEVA